jgi:phosphonate ABC transporter, permease protein PhnE
MARQRLIYTLLTIAAFVILFSGGIVMAENNNAGSFARGFSNFFDYPADLFSQAWEIGWGWPAMVVKHIPELLSTINMALFSTAAGFFLAIVLGVLGSRNIVSSPTIVMVTRRTMDICRSFPELVFAMILLYLMGRSLLPAVIAITIHTAGALGKLFSEAIENIDNKPIEGLRSTGASWFQRVRYAVLPQVWPLFFSYALLRMEINVRASTILGFVGAGGIGEALSTMIQWRFGGEILAIMFLLVATITSLDYLSRYVRARMIGENHS